MKPTLAAMIVALSATGGSAQEPQTPPCAAEIFRQFDFWAGAWQVFTPDGQKAGENVITIEENGCLLVERWTSASGATGQSYNYVDLAANQWRQIWVSAGATIDYAGGLNEDGAMVLKGEIAYPNGASAPFTGVWSLEEDGAVRQHFQQYNAETEEWADWFIGIYRKREAD